MKNRTLTTLFILFSFIFLTGNKLFCDENLDEKIKTLIKNNPEVAQEMIKKLYILEHTTPKIKMPAITIVETNSSNYIINYDSPMQIQIGTDKYNLLYDIELKPINAVIATKPVKNYTWIWMTGSAVLGFALGYLVVKATIP